MAGDMENTESIELACKVPDCGQIFHTLFGYKFHRMWHKNHGKGVRSRWTELHPDDEKENKANQQPKSLRKHKVNKRKESSGESTTAKAEDDDDDCVILEPEMNNVRTSTPVEKTVPATSEATKETSKSKEKQAEPVAELPSPIVSATPSEAAEPSRKRKRTEEQNSDTTNIPSKSSNNNENGSCKTAKLDEPKKEATNIGSNCSTRSENGSIKTQKLDHSLTNSSLSYYNKDVETSTLPLSVAIFARARQFPSEIMIIWCNSLEDDLLGAVCHNPAHSILCVQNLNAIQIPDSQRDLIKNSNYVHFNMADSNDIFTPWTVVSFMNNLPNGIKNKIFRNLSDVEKEFSTFASTCQMTVSNLTRYNKYGLFPYITQQLSTKIFAFNCPSECFTNNN